MELERSRGDNVEKSTTRKKRIVVAVVVVILLAGLALGLGLGLGLRPDDDGPPKTDRLLRRIDCYPEARWGRGEVDRGDCERRGCKYDPDPQAVDAAAPVCFVSADSPLGAGYWLSNMLSERPNGFTATLRTNIRAESSVSVIQPLSGVLEVEYAGENVLHLKVRYCCYCCYARRCIHCFLVVRPSVRCPALVCTLTHILCDAI